MKNIKTISSYLSVACTIIMAISLLCSGIVEDDGLRFAISGITLFLVFGLYLLREFIQKHDFSDRAMGQLKKAGLSCKKTKEGLVVKQGDFVMNVRLWNNGNHGLKRVHFMFNFIPDIINEVSPEGWAILASQCNSNFDHTTVKFYGDHFSCMVETSVKSSKDLLDEYRFAFDRIHETIQGLEANAPMVTKQFSVHRKRIGFM